MSHEAVVLVVDDQEMFDYMAPVIREELETRELIHCDNLADAMGWIRSDRMIDFLFCDWELAGPDFIRAVRHDPETHHSPLIVLLDSDRDELIGAAMRLGASDVITKPFMERGLANRIQRVVHNRERHLRKRIHVATGSNDGLTATLPGGEPIVLDPIDLSIMGARARGDLSTCGALCVYTEVMLRVCADEFCLELPGHVIRNEHDPSGRGDGESGPGKTIIIAFRFDEMDEPTLAQLRELLETLRSRYPE
ncbi:response regulator [Endothiovibrio diazotrophicus]